MDANKIVVYSTYNGSTVNGVLQGFGTFGSYDDPVNTVYGSINVKINDGHQGDKQCKVCRFGYPRPWKYVAFNIGQKILI